MGNYASKLRRERREELTLRVQQTFATKTEDGQAFPSSDYAYVPDPEMPSTWKLRLTSSPGGDPDPRIVGAAIAALGEGFRGNKVQIPAEDLAAVKDKVRAAWKKAHPDKSEEDIPSVVACGEMEKMDEMKMMGEMDDKEEEDSLGYGPVTSEADRSFLEGLKTHHSEILKLIASTDFDDMAVAEYAAHLAEKIIKSSTEIRKKLAMMPLEAVEAAPHEMY